MIERLNLLGFSGIANTLSAIKFAKYYELGEDDVVLTVLTDSMDLYGTRITEYREQMGEFTMYDAAETYGRDLKGETTDNLLELSYADRQRVHNLKYYTWVEQQGRTYEELMAPWYDTNYWTDIQKQVGEIDELIVEFNQKAGLLK